MNENSITVAIEIAAPPRRVWQVLTAFHGYTEWHPTLSAEGPVAEAVINTAIQFRLSGGAAGDQAFSALIVEASEPRRLAWEAGIPEIFFGRHTFELADSPGGGTQLTDTEAWTGSMAASVLAEQRVVLQAEYLRNAEALKAAAEAVAM